MNRSDFPLLQNYSDLAYLDNASTSQKPQVVIDAIAGFYLKNNANSHRAAYQLANQATRALEDSRQRVADFLKVSSEEIIFTSGTTEGINLLAATWPIYPDDEVIVTELEHHANYLPWLNRCEQVGAKMRVAPVLADGQLDLEALTGLLNGKTKVVAVTHVSNVLGTINPIKEIVALAHQVGAKVVVDGAQAVGHLSVDLSDLGCDAYAFSGHKMYGPLGIGVLWLKQDLAEKLPPWQTGGGIVSKVKPDEVCYLESPYCFEPGTPNTAGAVGLAAAIDYLESVGLENIVKHEQEMYSRLIQALKSVDGLQIFGPDERVPIVSFNLNDIHPHDVAQVLDSENVAIRAGLHCAQPLHDRYNLPASCRVSLAIYNEPKDIEQLVKGLKKAQEMFL